MVLPVIRTTKVPKIRFVANLSKMGEKKLMIYISLNNHKELLRAFKDKPMIVTCEEAIKDESDQDR
jgi:GH25 family lysozyme M1 (1,4-beta-N-acetylmuramidase)